MWVKLICVSLNSNSTRTYSDQCPCSVPKARDTPTTPFLVSSGTSLSARWKWLRKNMRIQMETQKLNCCTTQGWKCSSVTRMYSSLSDHWAKIGPPTWWPIRTSNGTGTQAMRRETVVSDETLRHSQTRCRKSCQCRASELEKKQTRPEAICTLKVLVVLSGNNWAQYVCFKRANWKILRSDSPWDPNSTEDSVWQCVISVSSARQQRITRCWTNARESCWIRSRDKLIGY